MLGLVLAAALMNGPLDYKSDAPFSVVVSSEPAAAGERAFTVRFPSAVKSPFEPNNTVWAHLFLPAGPGPHPCILVLPVMAAPNIWIETRFINRFRADGFAVLWVEMPYQFHRRPSLLVASGQVFLARTVKRLAVNYRQSVLDARRALAWLKQRPEIDGGRIGVFGISLGAIVGAAVYSVDPAPRYAVFMMGGADFPSLVSASTMTGPFVRKMGLSSREIEAQWKGIDPLDYKTSNAGKNALLINVRSDTVIPARNAFRLKEAFPGSRQIWLPLGHYTAIVHLVWVPRFISRMFRENMTGPRVKDR